MNTSKLSDKTPRFIIGLILSLVIMSSNASAGGISVDAGLTPPQNRWMVRSQMRYMQRINPPMPMGMEMKMYMFPVVVAYGLKPELTIMARQVFVKSEMLMNGNSMSKSSGRNDFFALAKYRITRINTPSYSIGIASIAGLNFPTGEDGFTSDSWDLKLGFYVTGRLRTIGIDLNTVYAWNGMANSGGDSKNNAGDEISLDAALDHQRGFGEGSDYAVAPVLELSYKKIIADSYDGATVDNSGESYFVISPGAKFTRSSLILESLVQIPVWQNQNGMQTERAPTFLLGFRYMY